MTLMIRTTFWAMVTMIGLTSFAAMAEHTIYLVRHAEKAKGKDPVLTAQGKQRAENLAQMLQDAGVTRVYSTDYRRTQQTAAPSAKQAD